MVAATQPAVAVAAAGTGVGGAGARMELATEERRTFDDKEEGAWPHISSICQQLVRLPLSSVGPEAAVTCFEFVRVTMASLWHPALVTTRPALLPVLSCSLPPQSKPHPKPPSSDFNQPLTRDENPRSMRYLHQYQSGEVRTTLNVSNNAPTDMESHES
jgi:hypothetical protein